MAKTKSNTGAKYILYFHLSPKTNCPWYLTIVNYENNNMPIMKDGKIIFFEEHEQIEEAYSLADNKHMLGNGPLPVPEVDIGVFDFLNLKKTILHKNKDRDCEIINCFNILDDFTKSIHFKPPQKYKEIYSDCVDYFTFYKFINEFLGDYNRSRAELIEAIEWHLKTIHSNSLLLPLNGELQKPTCKVESVLHTGERTKQQSIK